MSTAEVLAGGHCRRKRCRPFPSLDSSSPLHAAAEEREDRRCYRQTLLADSGGAYTAHALRDMQRFLVSQMGLKGSIEDE